MLTLEELRTAKREEILRAAARWGASNVRVFGSVARGDNRETSDVDLLVDLAPGRNLFDLGGLLMDLEDILGVKVDLTTPRSLRYMRESILAEAKPL